MFDNVPGPLRTPLWRVKHGLVTWLCQKGFVESFEVALARQLRQRAIDYVLDVGANRGQYARLVRRLGFKGKIISFEPLEDAYQAVLRQTRNDQNWTVHPVALGAESGSALINVTRLDVLSSLLKPNAESLHLLPGESVIQGTQSVRVCRLDELLAELVPENQWGRIHIKLDTQGFDLEVLKGLGETICRISSLQTELSVISLYEGQGDYVSALSYLRSHNFQPTCLYPLQRVDESRILELDGLFVRSG